MVEFFVLPLAEPCQASFNNMVRSIFDLNFLCSHRSKPECLEYSIDLQGREAFPLIDISVNCMLNYEFNRNLLFVVLEKCLNFVINCLYSPHARCHTVPLVRNAQLNIGQHTSMLTLNFQHGGRLPTSVYAVRC